MDASEVELVVAHEFGHRRDRHLAKATALGALGAAAVVVLLFALLRWSALLPAVNASGASDPRIDPFVLLLVSVLGLASLPVGTAIGRRWEAAADRTSIELTGNWDGFVEMVRELALFNLSDLEPGRMAYVFLFTHPTPPERIAAALRW
jgi:STE24 endopeptidase